MYLFLPADHTNGTRPGLADAAGDGGRQRPGARAWWSRPCRKSKFWAKTCILVTEDDPQNGFDHVDGHRTVGLAISPYTKRKAVDSTCYNQTGMVKTIELILGLPPMTQLDLVATPMRGCFTDTAGPDALHRGEEQDPAGRDEQGGRANSTGRRMSSRCSRCALDFDEEDRADEDTLNRILWFSVRGHVPYPDDR